MTEIASKLGLQAWVPRDTEDDAPSSDKLKPVAVVPDAPSRKPPRNTGLWTSTYDSDLGSGWIQWRLLEGFDCDPEKPDFRIWTLEPLPDARIYEIDTYADLEALYAAYPHEWRLSSGSAIRYPHWERIAVDFDGVHITDNGQWDTRLSSPLDLYGWDCESTLWLRWAFAEVADLGVVRVQEDEGESDEED